VLLLLLVGGEGERHVQVGGGGVRERFGFDREDWGRMGLIGGFVAGGGGGCVAVGARVGDVVVAAA